MEYIKRLQLLASCIRFVISTLKLKEEMHPAYSSICSGLFASKWHDRVSAVFTGSSMHALMRDLRVHSWHLLASQPGQFEALLPPGLLPSGFSAYKRLENGSVASHSPVAWPFGVLTAFCRLLTLRWADDAWARALMNNGDLVRYLKALLATRVGPPLISSPLFFFELSCLTDLLQLVIRRGPPDDAQIFLALALHILQHLHPRHAATARQLLARVVFAPPFTGLTVPSELADRLGRLDLSEAGSAAVLEDLGQNLTSVSSTYLDLIKAHSSAVEDEPCARLLPPDWPFFPILRLHQREYNQERAEESDLEKQRSLLHCLRFLSFLEISSRQLGFHLALGSAGKLVRLLSFFLHCGDLFLERLPAAHLSWQLKLLTEKPIDPNVVETAAGELFASFSDLYSAVLKEFFASSYGCPLFSSFVLLPTTVSFPVKIRRSFWREGRESLRMLRMEPNQCIFDVTALLEDDPRDPELLRLQAEALLSGTIQAPSLLFLVALHALNRALFVHAQPGTARRRFQSLVARSAGPDLAKQLFLYKDFISEATFYSDLPPIRETYLNTLLQAK